MGPGKKKFEISPGQKTQISFSDRFQLINNPTPGTLSNVESLILVANASAKPSMLDLT